MWMEVFERWLAKVAGRRAAEEAEREADEVGPSALVVGLGNPGLEYSATNHNMGFWCVDRLAEKHRLRFTGKRSKSVVARGTVAGQDVALAKPQTYMNLSGEAVKGLLAGWKMPTSALLVVYDDIDLPPGTIRIRQGGGPGTHNGMRSIVEEIRTESFPRLRIGIGGPPPGRDLAEYVLDHPTPENLPLLREAVERAVEAIEVFVRRGPAAAMNQFNT
jgi:peptidyl-tRNA hydrolase, PTH1 family